MTEYMPLHDLDLRVGDCIKHKSGASYEITQIEPYVDGLRLNGIDKGQIARLAPMAFYKRIPRVSQARVAILDQAKQAVTQDRAATHGDAERNFGLIAAYWSAHLDCTVSATDVAVMMGLLKLARARSNPAHMDNWIDLAGYAACGGEIAEGAAND